MKRKRIILLILVVVGFVAYAIFTGGLTYERIEDFQSRPGMRLAIDLSSFVGLNGQTTNFDIPLVFHYFSIKKPYDLSFSIYDDEKRYHAFEIAQVIVEYEDGESFRQDVSWSGQFQPHTSFNSSSRGVITTEEMKVSHSIQGIVKRHANVKITLIGNLIRTTGEKISFQGFYSFKAESCTQWGTWWEAIASC